MTAPSSSTPTPSDLIATITRAVAPEASTEDRRAGRTACGLLAAILGEPGEPASWPGGTGGGAARGRRPDGGQLLELAMAQMRAFLARHEGGAPTAHETTTGATGAAPQQQPQPAAPPSRPPLRIPVVGPHAMRPRR